MSVAIRQAWRGGPYPDDVRPGWWIVVDYDADFVAALKAAVPHPDRRWDDDRKAWWVSTLWEDRLRELLPSLEAFLRQAPLF